MAFNGVIIATVSDEPTGNPATGTVYIWVDSTTGRWKQKDSSGTVSDYLFASPTDINYFGTNAQNTSGSDSTNSTSYSDVATLNLTGLIVGKKYRVFANIATASSNSSAFAFIRSTLDGTQLREMDVDFTSSNYNIDINFLHYFVATAATATFKIQHRCSVTWATITTSSECESWRVN